MNAVFHNIAALSRYLGISRSSTYRRIQKGLLPDPIIVGGKKVWTAGLIHEHDRKLSLILEKRTAAKMGMLST